MPTRPLDNDPAILLALESCFGIPRERYLFVGRSDYSKDFDVIVEVASHEDIGSLKPDVGELNHLENVRCVIITSEADTSLHGESTTFVSRVVCPNCSVPEDPVTGSAHCTMAFHYGPRFLNGGTVAHMFAKQLSPRGGEMDVIWDSARRRVELRGRAISVSQGTMFVDI
ncbi:hypothetical protein HDU67_008736 [Dinochytrium kinnereticum]|nr:hypothetical protein HDU67_008736 [Dinochytrium kinnereticum]